MTDHLHTHCIGLSTIQSPEADRSRAFAHHMQFSLPRKAMSHNAGAQPTGHAHDARKADFGGTGSRDEKTASDGPENGLSVDTVKRADAWTETARDMLSTWDSYLGGQARDQRESANRLLLAASFARSQFEDLAAMDQDAATGGMLRAFLLALIDPAIPDLDHLRACNRPTPAPQGEAGDLISRDAAIKAIADMDNSVIHAIDAVDALRALPAPVSAVDVSETASGKHQSDLASAEAQQDTVPPSTKDGEA